MLDYEGAYLAITDIFAFIHQILKQGVVYMTSMENHYCDRLIDKKELKTYVPYSSSQIARLSVVECIETVCGVI